MMVPQGPRSQMMPNGIPSYFTPSRSLRLLVSMRLQSQKRMTFTIFFTPPSLQRDALMVNIVISVGLSQLIVLDPGL